jgi:hypothetical protein
VFQKPEVPAATAGAAAGPAPAGGE